MCTYANKIFVVTTTLIYGTSFAAGVILDLPIIDKCILPVNSPQFATLCRLPLGNIADMICDFDCRCTHGANVRGGRCGIPVGRDEPFCICDYGREEARAILLNIPCPGLPNLIGNSDEIPILGVLGELVIQPIFNEACDADCQCSHGYPDDGRNSLSTNNGEVGNQRTFCICGDGATLLTQV